MLTACLLAAALAQPLDTSRVKTTRAEATADFELSVAPAEGADVTFDGGADDRAVLHARFVGFAAQEGVSGLRPTLAEPDDGGLEGVSPAPARRPNLGHRVGPAGPAPDDVVPQGAWRTSQGHTTTWHFAAARYHASREGAGCCPPCPCSPDGRTCAPCVACVEEGDCRLVTRGVHLEATFTVVGRRLVKEHLQVHHVAKSVQRGRPGPGLRLERVSPADSPFARAVQQQRARLEACQPSPGGPSGRVVFALRFDAAGRVASVSAEDARGPAPLVKCLEARLSGVRGPAADGGLVHVHFTLQ